MVGRPLDVGSVAPCERRSWSPAAGRSSRAMVAAGVPVAVVVSDRPCPALEVAREAGVEALLVDRRRWGGFGPDFDRRGYTEALTALLSERSPDLVAMAGFGTVLAEPVHAAFGGRILNTHPALLPAFPGWHAVADALAAGVAVTGCTVHLATLEMDAGPVLAQQEVAVVDGRHRGLAPRADQGGRARGSIRPPCCGRSTSWRRTGSLEGIGRVAAEGRA